MTSKAPSDFSGESNSDMQDRARDILRRMAEEGAFAEAGQPSGLLYLVRRGVITPDSWKVNTASALGRSCALLAALIREGAVQEDGSLREPELLGLARLLSSFHGIRLPLAEA